MRFPSFTLFLLLLSFSSLTVFAQKKKAKKAAGGSLASSIAAGKLVFTQYCLTCHQADGLGVQNMNPSLAKTSYTMGDKSKIIPVVLNGLSHQPVDGDEYENAMPSHGFLTDKQIADVLTYVRNSFGNKASRIVAADVKALRVPAKG